MQDEATVGISFSQTAYLTEPAFDVVVGGQVFALDRPLVSIGSLTRIPCNDVALEGLADVQATLMVKDQLVFMRNLATGKMGPWQPGESVELGPHKLLLREHQPGLARFDLYSDPWRGRRYHLYDGDVLVGRPGKRSNHIFLDDVTVSRSHARLQWKEGKLWLQAETDVSPTCINGKVVEGQAVVKSGDLLQFGKQIGRLRYNQLRSSELAAEEFTLLHLDVNNYADLLENGADDHLVRQISQLYELANEAVEEAGGRLAAYNGESITGIFPPERLSQAVEAARKILAGCQDGELEVSCGIYTGSVTIAEVGFHHGQEVTPVGPGAQEAARLQAEAYARRVGLLLCAESQRRLG